MPADKPPPKTPEELISRIQEACREGGPYIFRGTDCKFPEVSSRIFRNQEYKEIFHEHFQPIDIEKEMVEGARSHLSSSATNVEILTDLRHFGGDTTLIDFSRSLFIALFFACNGKFEEDGELIAINTDGITKLSDIKYDHRTDHRSHEMGISILQPARTSLSRARVEFQSSIFVHVPKGYVSQCYYKTFAISKEMKQEVMQYLQKFHDITYDTIYNDLIGFVKNQENIETPMIWLFKGIAAQYIGKNEIAIEHYSKAIRLRPDFAVAYGGRGAAKSELGHYEDAISDCDEAIRLRPDFAVAYGGRGTAKFALERHEDAISDYNEAIRLKPDFAEAYWGRGTVKFALGRYKDAISDYDEAIIRKSDFAEVYGSRGIAKQSLGLKSQARGDFERMLALANERGDQELTAGAQGLLSGLDD